nr:hypothetical protein [Candidatus Woesearchaeota archaeon]
MFVPRFIKRMIVYNFLQLPEEERVLFTTLDWLTKKGKNELSSDNLDSKIEGIILSYSTNNEAAKIELYLRQLCINSNFRDEMVKKYKNIILFHLDKFSSRELMSYPSRQY